MSLGAMFVIGLLTSLHCVAMCGGINLSQCVGSASCADAGKRNTLRASLLYNLGRVLSYTAIGAVVGAIGSVVSFSGAAKGVVQLVAGIFMVIMGLNLLGIFPWLRKIAPRMPKIFARRLGAQGQGNGPLYVGLLNGLMPCGPLQAMQLYALSTGSAGMGAMSMLLFSLGTVPLMFGFGALSSLLNKKFTKRMMLVSAALVIVLGVSMFHNGIALSGFGAPVARAAAQPAEASTAPAEVQKITSQMSPNGYDPITVQAGVPVEWTLQAEAGDINGCNNEIVIPSLNISKKLQPGDNVIEFTPAQSGTIPFSCWMGMIRSSITVAEADAALPTAQAAEPLTAFFGPPAPTSATGGLPSCCQ